MPKVVVIGAGVMGLAAAYQALVDGSDVDILEASAEPGGMAAHFDFGGISIERFYHFVCKTDQLDISIDEGSRYRKQDALGVHHHGLLQRW